jgi:hypothetical protein
MKLEMINELPFPRVCQEAVASILCVNVAI